MPDVLVDGEVLEVDPPNRLVQTWRMHFDPTQVGGGLHHASRGRSSEGDDRYAG